MQVINLVQLISQLEQEKWDCVLQGAEFKPDLQMKILTIDRKLEKLYSWYTTAFLNGLVNDVPSTPFGPGGSMNDDRRSKRNKA